MVGTTARQRFPGTGRAGWWLLLLLSLLIAALALRYTLPRVPFAAPVPNATLRPGLLALHAGLGAVALACGPWQFLPGLRARRPALHRLLGRVSVACILTAGCAGLLLAPHAAAGAGAGFLSLAVVWLATTLMAVLRIRRGDAAAHRRWMIRSFALTAAAITLRLQLVAGIAAGWPFGVIYPVIAWTCWVPNLMAAEVWIARRPRPPAGGD